MDSDGDPNAMLPNPIKTTPRPPPSLDGVSSLFEFEDLIDVDDWLGIATLDPEKHGPSLKNSLLGLQKYV